jgi:hypothetical protein
MRTGDDFFKGFAARDALLLRENVLKAIEGGTGQCILHPLGFYLARLAAHGNTTFRLHYWPLGLRPKMTAMTPYHDHVWSLRSCVLVGAVENVLIELHRDETGPFQIAHIKQIADTDQVVPGPFRVRIGSESAHTYRAGEFYDIVPRIFHYTRVDPGHAALTVVQASVQVQEGPRTLLPLGSPGYMASRDPLPDATQMLSQIIDLLNPIAPQC